MVSYKKREVIYLKDIIHKLKVLHLVSGNDIGGAKTHLITLLSELQKKMNVLFVCLESGPSYRDALDAGINAISLEQKSRYDMKVLQKLKDIVENGKYQIMHCHGARANFVANKIRKSIRIPIATTIHSDYKRDFDHNLLKKLVFTKINERSLKKLDYYLTVTEAFKKDFEDRGFNRERIKVIYNGIEPNISSYKRADAKEKKRVLNKYGLDDFDGVIVGAATRLHPVKGVDVLIEAAALLKERFQDIKNPKNSEHDLPFKVIIAGSGSEEEKYKNLIIDKGLENTVFLIGYIRDMDEFYSVCDINVLSSFSESFPYALLEGGLRKIATVASKVGGIPEMIRDGRDGLLFESKNSVELCSRLVDLIVDEKLRNSLAVSFNSSIVSKFSAAAMAKRHIEIYSEILLENPKRLALCGYYGYKNSGDDAILAAILQSFGEIDRNLEVTILSKSPDMTKEEYGYKAVDRFNLIEVARLFRNTDLLVMGGGSLLQDKTSNRSLYYYLGLIHLALFKKVKVILYANGVGPINSNFNRKLTAWTLNKIDALTIREKYSYDFVKSMGIDKPELVITADPVFNLSYEDPVELEHKKIELAKVYEDEGIKKDVPIVGVMFRSWKGEESYVKSMSKICDAIVSKYGYQIVFLPMKHPADLTVMREIAAEMTQSSVLIENRYLPEIVLGLIQDMKLVLGMRLHSIIYAAVYTVPFIGFKYDPKVAYYTDELGMRLVENIDEIDKVQVMEYVEDIINNYDDYANKLRTRVVIMKDMAMENVKYIDKLL